MTLSICRYTDGNKLSSKMVGKGAIHVHKLEFDGDGEAYVSIC